MADQEMIDRVAKSIWGQYGGTREQATFAAIAAIKVLREPTYKMESNSGDLLSAYTTWTSMIDAILEC